MEKRVFEGEIRALDDEQGITEGKVFYNKKSVYMGFHERLIPGCFSNSLKQAEKGELNIFAFHNHDASKVLASTSAGTLRFKDTGEALEYTIIHNLEQTFSKDAWLSYRNDVSTTSFGMIVEKGRFAKDGTREIIEAGLLEVSPTPLPAYPDNTVMARNNKQNTKRGKKMATENKYTGEYLETILHRLEEAEYLSREYCEAGDEWDKISSVVHPGAPTIMNRDRRVSVEGLRNWASQSWNDDFTPEPFDSSTARDYGFNRHLDDNASESDYEKRTNSKQYRKSYNRYLVDGSAGISPSELRALQVDSDTAGGYIVSPQKTANRIVKKLDSEVFIRGLATKYPVPNAVSLGVPVLDNDPADSDWTSELGTGSEDSTMSFGKRELNPHPLAKRIKVSNKLLRASTLNAGNIVESRLIYKFAVTEEKAFLTGNGNNQPLGVFTASNDGISTSRDVSTDNTTTAVTTDGLIEAFHALRPQYQKNATWVMHPDTIKMVRKLKDGDGQYIFSPGIVNGTPATILGRPFFLSEFAPNTFTTGQYVGIVGDFSFYWIADALKMQIQRLIELYAESNQTGFVARLECDGMPTLGEAFSRITLA